MATVDGGITLDIAQEQLGLALSALADARKQQSFALSAPSGGRSVSRPQLEQLTADVQFWRKEVARLQRGSSGPKIWLGVAI